MNDYIKHLVQCRCIPPWEKREKDYNPFSFVVFSVVDERGDLDPHYAKCPNCGSVHRVTAWSTSEITSIDDIEIITIDEIKLTLDLPSSQLSQLEKYELDLPTWQEIKFVIENELWGRKVIVTKRSVDDDRIIMKWVSFTPAGMKIEQSEEIVTILL